MKESYIGITDFETAQQARSLLNLVGTMPYRSSKRKLMVGIMTSRKVLRGLETKWAHVWPIPDNIGKIFVEHDVAFNALHYADYDGIDLIDNLLLATEYAGENLHAIQLDMIWPTMGELKKYRKLYPNIQIILQINSVALDQVENNPQKLVAKLREYEDSVDYILMDKSMGRGLGMDAGVLLSFLREVSTKLPLLGLAVAGGLGPDTLEPLSPIIKEFPDISIDAQGQLRKSGNAMDPIDWNRATTYLLRAFRLFSSNE